MTSFHLHFRRFQRGQAHGREARLKGINVLLGPAMGPLGKMPAAGRNWEGFGADPVLQGVAAAETIKGIQSEGVIATGGSFAVIEFQILNMRSETLHSKRARTFPPII